MPLVLAWEVLTRGFQSRDTRPMNHARFWLLLGVFGAVALAASAQTVTLRTAAQEGSAPKFLETEGAAQGHCPDILRALEKADKDLRIEIDPTPTPIKRIEGDIKAGRLDVVCALLDTPLRNEIAHRISTPLFAVQERLVGRRDDPAVIRNFADLVKTGGRVVTQSGASYAAVLRSHGIQVEETAGGSVVALRNVQHQRVRFYYTNELTGAYYIKAEGLDDELRLLPGVLQATPSYLWASRTLDDATVQRLERALASLKRSGELDRIYRRYQKGK